MNKLQSFLPEDDNLFVTLNPVTPIDKDKILNTEIYHHPVYSLKAIEAQSNIKNIQGKLNTWYAGAWCGYGFHEDGLSAGLAVAEIAGRIKRPWQIKEKSNAYENIV
jgi:predicted NAD/FAD-binding protein